MTTEASRSTPCGNERDHSAAVKQAIVKIGDLQNVITEFTKPRYLIVEQDSGLSKDTDTFLPSKGDFSQFYTEFNVVGSLTGAIAGKTLMIKSASTRIELSLDAIIELIANHFKKPTPLTTDLTFNSKPPFVQDLDKIVDNKMMWIKAEFNNLICLSDRKIEKLCMDYYKVHAMPLIIRTKYLEWTTSLISYHVKKAELELELQKNEEIRQIHKEYERKNDAAEVKYRKGIEQFKDKITNQTRLMENLSEQFQGAQHKLRAAEVQYENAKLDVEDLNKKWRNAEDKLLKTERELAEATSKLEKQKTDQGWELEFACTPDKPIFFNSATGEVVELPVSFDIFKTIYKLKERTRENRIYQNINSEEVLSLPESLVQKFSTLMKSMTSKPTATNTESQSNTTGPSISTNEQRIIDLLSESEAPPTADEITTNLNIRKNHLYEYLNKLVEKNLITETFDAARKAKTYSLQ